MKKRNKGPTLTGSIFLMAAVILVLKFAYSAAQDESIAGGFLGNQVNLYDILYEELSNYSEKIEIGWDCSAELSYTYNRILRDHPELFWLSKTCRYEKISIGNKVSVKIYPKTELTLVEILRCRREVEEAAENILGGISEQWTDYEKLLYIHDTIVSSTEYDSECADRILSSENPEEIPGLWKSSSAYGCLVEHLAICTGYSSAFQLLCERIGIECIKVSGYERESGAAHEWNCVRLGQKWYYVDLTWDDPRYTDDKSIFVDTKWYDYFMITEETLSLTHVVREDEAVPICDDASLGYYRRIGAYAGEYSFDSVSQIIGRQFSGRMASVLFSSPDEADEAVHDLFENSRFYDIPFDDDISGLTVSYTVGKNGLLRIAVHPTE